MQSGLLTDNFSADHVARFAPDDWRRRSLEFQEPRLSRNLALRDALRPIAQRRGTTVSAAAVAWTVVATLLNLAVRHGDDQIASVLNRRGYSTGKGMRWNQIRVATARRNHSIAGQKRALPDPERVSLSQAARMCGVSHRTIERLVEAGLLKCEQVTPRAPWEIRRTDLDGEPIRGIIDRLHRTGKLILQGGCAEDQLALFIENAGDDNARHHE